MTSVKALTTKEMATLLRVAPKNVLARAEREDWDCERRAKKNGGDLWLVNEKMPQVTRAAIDAALARQADKLPAPITDVVVPDWAWERGKARYRVVTEWQAHVTAAAAKRIGRVEATATFIATANAGLLFPPAVMKTVGELTQATLYRWRKTLRENNNDFHMLADRRGGWTRGKPKGQGQIGEEAERAFLAVHLTPEQRSIQFSYNACKTYLEKNDLPVPSYHSVRRFFHRFDSMHHDLVVWMREGEKAYRDDVGKFLSRNDSVLQVGDILVADGHRLNFLAINPETGKACRMTLIGWQDWASRMFVGFDIMLNENTQAIASSFYRSVINLGRLPGAVYIDNGKAFKNKFFDGDVDIEEHDGLYARLGVIPLHSKPYEARSKIIERWWEDFDQQCAVGLTSYVGPSIDKKPAHMRRGEDWHRKEQAKVAHVPTVQEIQRIVIEFARWKAQQPHPTQPNTTPYEMFMAGKGPGFSAEDAEKLSRQFLYRKQVSPSRCRFPMFGIEFESDVLHGINKKLTAHFSYSDLSEVYVYDGPELLCVARPVATVHPMAKLYGDALDVATVKAAQKEQARLKADTQRLATALKARGGPGEVLEALPWNLPASERRTPLELRECATSATSAVEAAPAALTAEERAEILAITQAANKERPAYECPAFFASKLDKYDFLHSVMWERGLPLTAEDAAFMAAFEQSPDFGVAKSRYDQLNAFYAKQEKRA